MTKESADQFFAYMLSHVLRAKNVRLLPIVNDLPDDLAAVLGRIVATWSEIEWMVKSSSYPLLGLSAKEGRVAVRDPRLEDHITMVEELLSMRGLTVKSDLSAIQLQLRKLNPYRDLFVHGLWMRDEQNKLYVQRIKGTWQPDKDGPKVSRRIQPEGLEINAAHLEQLLRFMRITLDLVRDMNGEIVRVAASAPRRWPPQSAEDHPSRGP